MLRHAHHKTDFCVVGGGLAGLCAAVAAARRGIKVALMHDRPVLGGNASSEVRMWISGASGKGYRETGLLEEIHLENNFRNPYSNWSIWDTVLYEIVRFEPNVTLLLNCSCNDAVMEGSRIRSVKGWQLTTQTWHTVEADLFADCSGDSILAPLSGADFRWGREASAEFGESIAPAEADRKTMGMSCLIQARETDTPKTFVPPAWAHTYPREEDLGNRNHDFRGASNFWWLELGGEQDTIHDTEEIRDELLKVALGVWDHVKNHGDHGADNWELDWIGFLPGKRESRRCMGDYILTQSDLDAGKRFDDIVAYGGWSLDDHPPAGFAHRGRPTHRERVKAPYGIPYRCLYSRNIDNLLFAGRNISCSHAALSSTRVMATCATLGQAVGTAAAIAAQHTVTPGQVYRHHLGDLQQAILDDDSTLPGLQRAVPALSRDAALMASEGDPEPLRNGVDRPVGDAGNAWTGNPGSWIEYTFDSPQHIEEARIVFDSDLNRKGAFWHVELNAVANYPLHEPPRTVPCTLVRAFRLEASDDGDAWRILQATRDNHQRLVRVPLQTSAKAVRLVPASTWGADRARVFAFDVR